MTTEATYAPLHRIDRWRLTLLALAGEPLPPLPPINGHRHRAPDRDDDPLADEWDRRTTPATLIDTEDTAPD